MKVRAKGCCGGASRLSVQDEGDDLGNVDTMNFVGAAVSVTKSGNTATVTVASTGGGGGGLNPIVDFNMVASLPSSPTAGDRYRVILPSPFNPVQIGNIFYNHKNIIEYSSDGYWIRYESETT